MIRDGDGEREGADAAAGADADGQLVAAVNEYMSEIDAGRRPNRQTFIARHPGIADELAACIQGLSFVQTAAAQIRRPDAGAAGRREAPIDLAASQPLGDFKLVREIGRGGMGVVYEAVQLSLGRRVAVKVLSMAGALDARHLKRFRNEAQAAAQLHHTNIVPVYAVGCERSVHFYAMQLIDGQSLAHVIEELRDLRAETGDDAITPQPHETVQLSGGAGTEFILDSDGVPAHPSPRPTPRTTPSQPVRPRLASRNSRRCARPSAPPTSAPSPSSGSRRPTRWHTRIPSASSTATSSPPTSSSTPAGTSGSPTSASPSSTRTATSPAPATSSAPSAT
jgi:hypothetical protein